MILVTEHPISNVIVQQLSNDNNNKRLMFNLVHVL